MSLYLVIALLDIVLGGMLLSLRSSPQLSPPLNPALSPPPSLPRT